MADSNSNNDMSAFADQSINNNTGVAAEAEEIENVNGDMNHGDDDNDANSSSSVNSPNGTTYWCPKCPDEFKPRIGQIFNNELEGIAFYKAYARVSGFSVRMATTKNRYGITINKDKAGRTRTRTLRYMLCHREGTHVERAPVDTLHNKKKRKRTRRVTRCGCLAKIQLRLIGGGRWEVYKFEERHNHRLTSEVGKQFLRPNRKLVFSQQNFLFGCGNQGVGPSKAHRIMKEISGGYQHVGATAVDCKNFKRDLKVFINGCDAQLLVDKLLHKMNTCKGFTFERSEDGQGTLRRLFWADQHSKRDSILFGDVVSFDATYGTNKYNMVFVPFIGVDNHKRSVTLAAGLISNEDIESYSWLLSCYKKMSGREPNVLVTDQDPAIKIAVERTCPSSVHRFCMWHITEKLKAKVGISFCKETDFLKSISSIVWDDNLSPVEFENRWKEVIEVFELSDNKWLSDMFDVRASWIPSYFRDVHMGSLLRTTSRSESENSFFGKFLHPDMTLVEFYFGFDRAMDTQRSSRNKLETESCLSTPKIVSKLSIEKHAAEVFTYEIFKEIQAEIEAAGYGIAIHRISEIEDGTVYYIREKETKEVEYTVSLSSANKGEMRCSCKKYFSSGILCRHLLNVMTYLDYEKIPDEFIMRRWHRDALQMVTQECGDFDFESVSSSKDQNIIASEIWFQVRCDLNKCKDNEDKLREFLDHINAFNIDAFNADEDDGPRSKTRYFESALGVSQPSQVTINTPAIARNKGCGRRLKSDREISIENSKKSLRRCAYCKELVHHDKRTCPKRRADMKQDAVLDDSE